MSSFPTLLPPLLWLLILLLPLTGCSESPPPPSESLAQAADDSQMEHARKHLDPKYVCPMHPQIVRDEPGSCPICGMDLVPKRIERNVAEGPKVALSDNTMKAMNLRTAKVERRTLWRYIETLGRIGYDETRLYHLHPRAAGWVEHMAPKSEGDAVRKDQPLVQLYSPEILDAQVDYLIALQGGVDEQRRRKAKNRLRLLEVPEDVISTISSSGDTQRQIPLRAMADGVVAKLNIRHGMYVRPDTELMTLADPSKVWVVADVFEHQLDWVHTGLSAEVRLPALPGRKWEGTVEYVYPEVDPVTRTLRVRIGVDNADGVLRPNLFSQVVIYGGPRQGLLSIPKEALISEEGRSVVIKRDRNGTFTPVDVTTGMRSADHVELLSGLQEGDEIVTSGQFLIDSEANIQASLARMGSAAPAADSHNGH